MVVVLLVAATFPAIFSPPGSVRQGDNNPTTIINGTTYINTNASGKRSPLPGTVVMDSATFLYVSTCNTGTFHAAICLTCLLLPNGFLGLVVLLSCYCINADNLTDVVIIRIVNSLFLNFMYTAVTFILLIHEGGKRILMRLCYTAN